MCIRDRTYDSHEAKVTEDRQDSAANTYLEFQGNILKYSNDGAFYTDTSNELIWNQSYEMSDPVVVMSAKYAAIGDEKGTLVYIFDKDGLCGNCLLYTSVLYGIIPKVPTSGI